ncbi:MAG: hypothetical protein V3V30_05710 [Parvularculaceae bacterium]
MYTPNKVILLSVASIMALSTAACAKGGDQKSSKEQDVIAQEIVEAQKSQDRALNDTSVAEATPQDDILPDPQADSLEGGINDVAAVTADTLESYSTEQPVETAALSKQETISLSKAKFAIADRNGDGALSQDEFVAMTVDMSETLEIAIADIEPQIGSAPETLDMTDEADTLDVAPQTKQTGEELNDNANVTVSADATEKFAEISPDGQPVSEQIIIADVVTDFDKADVDGDDIIEGEELIQFAEMATKPDTAKKL